MLRQCTQCAKLGVGPKPHSEFCKGSGAHGLQSMCREHTREYNRAWAKRNPDKNREKGKRFREVNKTGYKRIAVRAHLKNSYGLSVEQYEGMLRNQNHQCLICECGLVSQASTERMGKGHAPNNVARVDHDHQTGEVRGLLCFSCNVGLGKFRDDPKVLLAAIRYLRATATGKVVSRPRDVKSERDDEPSLTGPLVEQRRGSRLDELNPFLN